MTVAAFLARLRQAKRRRQPRVCIHLYVFTQTHQCAVTLRLPCSILIGE